LLNVTGKIRARGRTKSIILTGTPRYETTMSYFPIGVLDALYFMMISEKMKCPSRGTKASGPLAKPGFEE
jgi:hypothetical protein